jgi:hypothetical protein
MTTTMVSSVEHARRTCGFGCHPTLRAARAALRRLSGPARVEMAARWCGACHCWHLRREDVPHDRKEA